MSPEALVRINLDASYTHELVC